jgi:hypothetical protein
MTPQRVRTLSGCERQASSGKQRLRRDFWALLTSAKAAQGAPRAKTLQDAGRAHHGAAQKPGHGHVMHWTTRHNSPAEHWESS